MYVYTTACCEQTKCVGVGGGGGGRINGIENYRDRLQFALQEYPCLPALKFPCS